MDGKLRLYDSFDYGFNIVMLRSVNRKPPIIRIIILHKDFPVRKIKDQHCHAQVASLRSQGLYIQADRVVIDVCCDLPIIDSQFTSFSRPNACFLKLYSSVGACTL
jgi:hypothetical protein